MDGTNFLQNDISYSSLQERRRRKLVLVNGVAFVTNLFMVGIQIAILGPSASTGIMVSAIISVGFAGAFLSAWFAYHHVMIGRISLYVMATAVTYEVAMSGGISGYFSHAIVALPVMSAFLLGARDTVIFTLFNSMLLGMVIWLDARLPLFVLEPETAFIASSMTVICTMAGMGLVAIMLVRDTERTDATLQHLLEQQTYLANHDPLTGLANRANVSAQLTALSLHQDTFHVFMIDLDGFKQINDQFGHGAGDKVLVLVAQRLEKMVKNAHIVARLGGDEFLVAIHADQLGQQSLQAFGTRLAKVLRISFQSEGQALPLSGSVGSATFPDDGRDQSVLLSNADAALYAAKRAGKATYRCFDADMRGASASYSPAQNEQVSTKYLQVR